MVEAYQVTDAIARAEAFAENAFLFCAEDIEDPRLIERVILVRKLPGDAEVAFDRGNVDEDARNVASQAHEAVERPVEPDVQREKVLDGDGSVAICRARVSLEPFARFAVDFRAALEQLFEGRVFGDDLAELEPATGVAGLLLDGLRRCLCLLS